MPFDAVDDKFDPSMSDGKAVILAEAVGELDLAASLQILFSMFSSPEYEQQK